jgi:large subunit ribosomal protein L9
MATIPTPHNLRLLERYKIRVRQAKEARIADLRALAEQISKLAGITIEANANDEGHLYGSVGGAEVSKGLRGRNLPVEADMVRLEGVIKETGLYEVSLILGLDIESKPIEAKVKVAVIKAQK